MSYKELLAQKKKDKSGRELTAAYIKFDKVGVSVVGRLMAMNAVSGSMGAIGYKQYLFHTDDDLVKCALGSATDNEAGALMNIGGIYSVTYKGKESLKGGRSINKFEIIELEAAGESGVGGVADVPF